MAGVKSRAHGDVRAYTSSGCYHFILIQQVWPEVRGQDPPSMRRRHFFLIASLLLVAAVLGTLLWLRHRALPEAVRLLPESDAVVFVNVKAIRRVAGHQPAPGWCTSPSMTNLSARAGSTSSATSTTWRWRYTPRQRGAALFRDFQRALRYAKAAGLPAQACEESRSATDTSRSSRSRRKTAWCGWRCWI